MANETYTLIQKTTLNASAASITLSSIPQTFTDLVVKISSRSDAATTQYNSFIRPNAATTGYREVAWYFYSTSILAITGANTSLYYSYAAGNTSLANTFSSNEIYINNYSSTTLFKQFSIDSSVENNNIGTGYVIIHDGGTWASTSQMTSLYLSPESGNYLAGTTVSLYGVAKLNVSPVAGPKASGGDIITNDGTYWIHQFLNSGTFTPSSTLSCDYLVVAGGAGGGAGQTGNSLAGGGGAGGLRSTVTATGGGGSLETALSLTGGTSYTVTIGAGGTATSGTPGQSGTNGGNSVFSTITSTGGGFGAGGSSGASGASGGSGGGGRNNNSSLGGAGTANQGRAGGNGQGTGGDSGGGGGGAGAVGGNGSGQQGGNGGNGVATSISGSSVTYAGGGGGSTDNTGTVPTGGTGGGGTGSKNNGGNATAGTVNLGGGGGGGSAGSGANQYGGNGGSGIVIIRYAI
jgi:hypothetical protein